MKILLLAPQPFYQERGTPIAVNILVKSLSQRGDEIDLLTLGEGEDVFYPNLTIRRTPRFIRKIRPGFSFKKILSDIMMAGIASGMVVRKRYDIVHAVEESVFIAMMLRILFRVPYVYDMDSSLAQQMVERMPYLRPFSGVLRYFEGRAIKRSTAVIAMCQALVDTVHDYDEGKSVCLLHDVTHAARPTANRTIENIRDLIAAPGPLMLYVGNLENYQGIGLVLESMALKRQALSSAQVRLAIIGGLKDDIDAYRAMSKELGIGDLVHFLGPRPLEHLADYLRQADILVSPRTKGNNTPMKIYGYLQSGKPVLATSIYSHTQVLDETIAQLAPPEPEPFAESMVKLVNDPELRTALGAAGQRRVREKYSYEAYKKTLYSFYADLEKNNPSKGEVAAARPRK